MTVGQAMTRRPATLSSDDTLARAVELTLTTPQADFPVFDSYNGRPVGLLTAKKLLQGLQHHDERTAVRVVNVNQEERQPVAVG